MNKRYFISQEQLEELDYFKRMFELESDTLANLCSSEKSDIVYGFALGQEHFHLRQCYMKMMDLLDEIMKQRK